MCKEIYASYVTINTPIPDGVRRMSMHCLRRLPRIYRLFIAIRDDAAIDR